MGLSLVALDTDHIKGYVFATDKLKEIRGASSILDRLNRRAMRRLALSEDPKAIEVYANGGSGLFVLDSKKAVSFGKKVQKEYREQTAGGASITYAVQDLPDDVNHNNIWEYPLGNQLELLRYCLREAKECPPDHIALPSHVLMRPCDSCGIQYAEDRDTFSEDRDLDDQNKRYCKVCLTKREEDMKVKVHIEGSISERKRNGKLASRAEEWTLWERIISLLPEGYLQVGTERPRDFNEFRGISGGKDYLGLIYADGNSMGKRLEDFSKLKDVKQFAHAVDNAIYEAMCFAISKRLAIIPGDKSKHEPPMFPFDILLIGGDDIMIVTSASEALDVSLLIAKKFHELTKEEETGGEGYTLSVGVVLAPIKYPFALLQDLVESTLRFAKTAGAKVQATGEAGNDDTRVNFMTVTGSSSHNFKETYDRVYHRKDRGGRIEFFATLRPYDVEQLDSLLQAIRQGKENKINLGRTKLHQAREAVLKKNLTTSVGEGLAVLRNWRAKQRDYVVQRVYEFGGRYQMPRSDPQNPVSGFPRVTFPWFADGVNKQGTKMYRTPLLDFVELYDFVAREEVDDGDET